MRNYFPVFFSNTQAKNADFTTSPILCFIFPILCLFILIIESAIITLRMNRKGFLDEKTKGVQSFFYESMAL
ncbi:hypothetical protein CS916_001335 [Enterococcus faecium]|nr:hypothetical protein CS916_001335 [Enterococcus faecium]